jgi:hypothetical protein
VKVFVTIAYALSNRSNRNVPPVGVVVVVVRISVRMSNARALRIIAHLDPITTVEQRSRTSVARQPPVHPSRWKTGHGLTHRAAMC